MTAKNTLSRAVLLYAVSFISLGSIAHTGEKGTARHPMKTADITASILGITSRTEGMPPDSVFTMIFGNDTGATAGYDSLSPTVQEKEYPPWAPCHDARWASYNIYYSFFSKPYDIRGVVADPSVKDTFRLLLEMDPGCGDTTLQLHWPEAPYLAERCDSLILKYLDYTTGRWVWLDMFTTNHLEYVGDTSAGPWSYAFWIYKTGVKIVDSVDMQPSMVDYPFATCARGWNLVSVPATSGDSSLTSLFPSAISDAYGYTEGSGYTPTTTLVKGAGYWIRLPSTAYFADTAVSGLPDDTIDIVEGWNLIGSIPGVIPVSVISSDPPGIITGEFFGYSGGYQPVTTLKPGREGYWVNSQSAGKLILSTSPTADAVARRIRIMPDNELPPSPPAHPDDTPKLPRTFALSQNYPNPFNPSTTIKYALPAGAPVTLRIYNLLGQVVATLVDGVETAGYKSVEFDASRLPSGIYFYRLQAGSRFAETRKLMVLK